MTYQHQALAAGRWGRFTFCEQMANMGSEVERALSWNRRQNPGYARQAFERALELLDFTLADARNAPRLRELARLREALADFFVGDNRYGSTEDSWRSYLAPFAYAARRDR